MNQLTHQPAWHQLAKCRGMDPHLFESDHWPLPRLRKEGWTSPDDLASTLCHGCPVLAECALDAAEADVLPYGTLRGGVMIAEMHAIGRWGDRVDHIRARLMKAAGRG
ncbi:WhiB family transcriptional regulator [Corynebacterium hindlerae]|uniref:WhiB family transcriptional regulator n=1 Tax=Corynebacterium hindlerae TaxID=699041 RepID=A0A7G5FDQ0_9CORY|nr:WhiB family transcriptional regulator [Corynebacterium hindlerae]QMV84741.1 WhiB family transcriptional regulator [Corynebacterium hindlerae]